MPMREREQEGKYMRERGGEHEWGEWTRIRLTIYYYNVRVYAYAH